MELKIVLLDRSTLGDVSIDCLKKYGTLTVYENTLSNETAERVVDQNIIVTNKVLINKSVMEASKDLKLVCITATGINNVDIEYAKQKGIKVKNVSGYSTESVAQTTFSSLLYLIHQLDYFNNYVKSGSYEMSDIFTHHGRSFWQLKNKKFGIIGFGNIGQRVAEIGKAFGSNVVYFSTSGQNNNHSIPHENLDSLLSTSDVVSIHAPLNERTLGLINYDNLSLMKKNAFLVNMGRGGIVNEFDLAKALDEDLIAGAALDVLGKEPIEASNPLLKIKSPHKLLITPHIAWASVEARDLLLDKVCSNIEDYLRTGN
jgi:lactate dehydrogenase-like 2-hydroxyacid dehydrogenase